MKWDERFERCLRRYIPTLPRATEISPDANLRSFGLDSISLIGLITALEDMYAIRIPDEEVSLRSFATPSGIWTLVQERRGV